MNHKTKIAFVGLGLIGGSIAKAIRQYYPDHEIIAFDKSKETLALATQESVVDVACTSIDDNFANCNYIFLCAPVAYNTAYLKQLKNYVSEDCILTDVGSVKTSIHKEIISLDMEANFIGGHPMAGSEKSGFANSKAHLIENAYYILTPSAKVSQDKLDSYYKFVESLKALPVTLSYEEHDYITGAGSRAMPSYAAPVYCPLSDGPPVSIMIKVQMISRPGIMAMPSSTPVLPPSIMVVSSRVPPLPAESSAEDCSLCTISAGTASFPIPAAVKNSINRVLTTLPHTAPRLPHSAAQKLLLTPSPVSRPSTKAVTMSPMPKDVPRLVSAGIWYCRKNRRYVRS